MSGAGNSSEGIAGAKPWEGFWEAVASPLGLGEGVKEGSWEESGGRDMLALERRRFCNDSWRCQQPDAKRAQAALAQEDDPLAGQVKSVSREHKVCWHRRLCDTSGSNSELTVCAHALHSL